MLLTRRTFLAWLRTGIAIIAFGFVVEKFNIFLSSLMGANDELGRLIRLDRVSGPPGRYEGLALMATGIVVTVLSYVRFIRDKRRIDNSEATTRRGVRSELIVTITLVLLVWVYCIAILFR